MTWCSRLGLRESDWDLMNQTGTDESDWDLVNQTGTW